MPDFEVRTIRHLVEVQTLSISTEPVLDAATLTGDLHFPAFGLAGEIDNDFDGVVGSLRLGFSAFTFAGNIHPHALPQDTVIDVPTIRFSATVHSVLPNITEDNLITVRDGLSFPSFRTMAQASVPSGARGELGFTSFSIMAEAEVPIGITSALSFPQLRTGGEVLVPPLAIVMGASFVPFAVAGDVGVPLGLRGAPSFTGLSMAGDVNAKQNVQGVFGFPEFNVASTMLADIPEQVEGDFSFPAFAINARVRNVKFNFQLTTSPGIGSNIGIRFDW